jgi:hypothetical protein
VLVNSDEVGNDIKYDLDPRLNETMRIPTEEWIQQQIDAPGQSMISKQRREEKKRRKQQEQEQQQQQQKG